MKFDVIIIGGGHAGCEAAAASARMGANTALITHKISTIGEMSCNPAFGGLGKGHLVREIDALDGVMAKAIDQAGIQFRVLNKSKGPAVRGPRAQADRKLYRQAMQSILSEIDNLTIVEDEVEDLIITDERLRGVRTSKHEGIQANAVVLTTGTFLDGEIHIGNERIKAGRWGEKPSVALSKTLYNLGFAMGRLKTGTPARLDKKSIKWDILEIQAGDNPPEPFSYLTNKISVPQIPCHMTWTNKQVHETIWDNIRTSAVYSGQIDSTGPRYCPSIEDKVYRFRDKERHQIFLEPEGLDCDTVYPNGISTSLPKQIQDKFLRQIKGLEDVIIKQYGYAIVYDYIDPRELYQTLETKKIKNLFFAGQINGTTGYEEAGTQGLIAGINAALQCNEYTGTFTIGRSEGYMGVLIDDLTTLGTKEPYRMFTSRAEYRLSLRADNADLRLTQKGIDIGCVSQFRASSFLKKQKRLTEMKLHMQNLKISPSKLKVYDHHINQDGVVKSAFELLKYKDIQWNDIQKIWPELENVESRIIEQIEIEALYSGYLERQNREIKSFEKDENLALPISLDYSQIGSLSSEIIEKLTKTRPSSLGAAKRIPGMTPAALISLLRHVKRTQIGKKNEV